MVKNKTKILISHPSLLTLGPTPAPSLLTLGPTPTCYKYTPIPAHSISSIYLFPLSHCLYLSKQNPSFIRNPPRPLKAHSELAHPNSTTKPATRPEILEESVPEPEGEASKWAVRSLYEALNNRDVDRVTQILAPDLEWWFHGPPTHQHMMRLLTGATQEEEDQQVVGPAFQFVPLSIEAFGPTVLVEGLDRSGSVFWVHAWTVGPDGIITQVREYFNTSVTVTRFGKRSAPHCLPVWQSRLSDGAGKSLPGLVLAI